MKYIKYGLIVALFFPITAFGQLSFDESVEDEYNSIYKSLTDRQRSNIRSETGLDTESYDFLSSDGKGAALLVDTKAEIVQIDTALLLKYYETDSRFPDTRQDSLVFINAIIEKINEKVKTDEKKNFLYADAQTYGDTLVLSIGTLFNKMQFQITEQKYRSFNKSSTLGSIWASSLRGDEDFTYEDIKFYSDSTSVKDEELILNTSSYLNQRYLYGYLSAVSRSNMAGVAEIKTRLSCYFKIIMYQPYGLESNGKVMFEDNQELKNYLLNYVLVDTDGNDKLDSKLDLNRDNKLQKSETDLLKHLELKKTYSIEAFTRLIELSRNPEGESLSPLKLDESPEITNLSSLSELTNLRYLSISDSNIDTVSIAHLPQLDSFSISNLNTSHFRLMDNPNISYISASGSAVTVEIENLDNLRFLELVQITNESIELEDLPNLQDLSIRYGSRLKSVRLDKLANLKNANISGGYKLKDLSISDTPLLEKLTWNNSDQEAKFDISGAPKLWYYSSEHCHYPTLNLSNLDNLESVICTDNKLLTEAEFSNLPNCKIIDISDNNGLSELALGNLPNLLTLKCNSAKLSSLYVSTFKHLVELDCSDNMLNSIELSNNPEIKKLDCSKNQITSLDASHMSNLERLLCSGNQINHIELLNHPYLKTLGVSSMAELKLIDASGAVNLEEIWCHSSLVDTVFLANDSMRIKSISCSENILAKNTRSNWVKKAIIPEFPRQMLGDAKQDKRDKNYAACLELYQAYDKIEGLNKKELIDAAECAALSKNYTATERLLKKAISMGHVDLIEIFDDSSFENFVDRPEKEAVIEAYENVFDELEQKLSGIANVDIHDLVPYQKNGLWGYLDKSTRNTIVEPLFNSASFAGVNLKAKLPNRSTIIIYPSGEVKPYVIRPTGPVKRSSSTSGSKETSCVSYLADKSNTTGGFRIEGDTIYVSTIYDDFTFGESEGCRHEKILFGLFEHAGNNFAYADKDNLRSVVDTRGRVYCGGTFRFTELREIDSHGREELWFTYTNKDRQRGFVSLSGEERFFSFLNDKKSGYYSRHKFVSIRLNNDQYGIFNNQSLSWQIAPTDMMITEVSYTSDIDYMTETWCKDDRKKNYYFLNTDDRENQYYIGEDGVSYRPN